MVNHWQGILPALWSPTDTDGKVLGEELRNNVRFVIERGVHGLLALGSTGEFLQLDPGQWRRLLEITLETAGSLPVVVNISDIRPKIVAERAEFARNAGAAAVTVLPPYFFPVPQLDLVEFFVRAGEVAKLPLFLYNFPERTGNRIALETVAAVADRIELAGIKQSGAEFDYHKELISLGHEKGFVVVTGSDTRLEEAMNLGVAGCVSGLSNAVPELTVEIYNAVKQGDRARASIATQRMQSLGKLVERIEFPFNVSAIIEARGQSVGHPKTIVSTDTQSRYQTLVEEFRTLFREWNLIQ